MSDRIKDMGENIEKTLKEKAQAFDFFSLALDESTDITNTAQLAIFIRGTTSDFEIQEDLLSLESMHGTTRGEDLFEKLLLAMRKFNLPFERLSGLATDGAPAMVGSQKGLTTLVKREMTRYGLNASDLVVCHCVIHQENLCAKSVKLSNVMPIVIKCINFIKNRGLNSRLFKQLLEDLNSDYHDLVYHCAVRWLSRSDMLTRFYLLRNEVDQFMNNQGNHVVELTDSQWLCDLEFMVDISKHLSELNVKLQGPSQLLNSLFAKVKSFEAKLHLWKVQLESNNTAHFPILQEQKPSTTAKYALVCVNLMETFNARFLDIKCKEMELDIFASPFNVVVTDVPSNFQHEIIELQSDSTLKAMYQNIPLLNFYQRYINADDFPVMRKHALKYASLFGSTYRCEQFFSKLNLTKSRLRSRLTDENVEMQLRVATSSVSADITRLTKNKNFQPSH